MDKSHWIVSKPHQRSQVLPCKDLTDYPECSDYCNWHKQYIQKTEKDELLSIMRYAQPQRKITLDLTKEELKLAGI